MDIPVIVRCVPPAVPPLDGVTDWILTIWIRNAKKRTNAFSKLRRRRLLCGSWKCA